MKEFVSMAKKGKSRYKERNRNKSNVGAKARLSKKKGRSPCALARGATTESVLSEENSKKCKKRSSQHQPQRSPNPRRQKISPAGKSTENGGNALRSVQRENRPLNLLEGGSPRRAFTSTKEERSERETPKRGAKSQTGLSQKKEGIQKVPF